MLFKGALNLWFGIGLGTALIGALVFLFAAPVCGCGGGAVPSVDLSNVKQWALANAMYMADYDGEGALPSRWMDQLGWYLTSSDQEEVVILRRPRLKGNDQFGYAFLDALGKVHDADVVDPQSIPTVFDSSDMHKNAHGTLALLPDPPLWDGHNMVGFLDGHAKRIEGVPSYTLRTSSPAP